jgi:hypothetical protein
MFKKFLIGEIILITGILFGGCSEKKVELKMNSERIEESQEGRNVSENSQEFFQGQTIQELLNQKNNLECSWRIEKAEISADADVENVDEEASGGIEEGKIYFKEGQLFQEIQITENSRKTIIKTLKDGDWFYQWNSLVANQGIKMSFEKAKNSEFLNINKIYDWNCQKFYESADVFEIPEDIDFFNF